MFIVPHSKATGSLDTLLDRGRGSCIGYCAMPVDNTVAGGKYCFTYHDMELLLSY